MKNLEQGQRVFWLYRTPDDEVIIHEREVNSFDLKSNRYGLIVSGQADRGINFVRKEDVFPSYEEVLERFKQIIEEQDKQFEKAKEEMSHKLKEMGVAKELNRDRYNRITQSLEDYSRRNMMKI
jgi:hypothetical protein